MKDSVEKLYLVEDSIKILENDLQFVLKNNYFYNFCKWIIPYIMTFNSFVLGLIPLIYSNQGLFFYCGFTNIICAFVQIYYIDNFNKTEKINLIRGEIAFLSNIQRDTKLTCDDIRRRVKNVRKIVYK
jgi:hypothetical protein